MRTRHLARLSVLAVPLLLAGCLGGGSEERPDETDGGDQVATEPTPEHANPLPPIDPEPETGEPDPASEPEPSTVTELPDGPPQDSILVELPAEIDGDVEPGVYSFGTDADRLQSSLSASTDTRAHLGALDRDGVFVWSSFDGSSAGFTLDSADGPIYLIVEDATDLTLAVEHGGEAQGPRSDRLTDPPHDATVLNLPATIDQDTEPGVYLVANDEQRITFHVEVQATNGEVWIGGPAANGHVAWDLYGDGLSFAGGTRTGPVYVEVIETAPSLTLTFEAG